MTSTRSARRAHPHSTHSTQPPQPQKRSAASDASFARAASAPAGEVRGCDQGLLAGPAGGRAAARIRGSPPEGACALLAAAGARTFLLHACCTCGTPRPPPSLSPPPPPRRRLFVGIAQLSGPGEPAADFLIQGPADAPSAAGAAPGGGAPLPSHGVPGLCCLYGIESPGLTAALAIARVVAEKLAPAAE